MRELGLLTWCILTASVVATAKPESGTIGAARDEFTRLQQQIDYYRSQHRRLPASYLDDSFDPEQLAAAEHEQPERLEDRRRQAEQLLQAVSELPEAQREVFLLRVEAGLSLEAIAEATEVSRETAKSRLRYAVAKLRQQLHMEVTS